MNADPKTDRRASHVEAIEQLIKRADRAEERSARLARRLVITIAVFGALMAASLAGMAILIEQNQQRVNEIQASRRTSLAVTCKTANGLKYVARVLIGADLTRLPEKVQDQLHSENCEVFVEQFTSGDPQPKPKPKPK